MKVYLVVDDDNGWIASAHFDKSEADDRIKGSRNRSVKEIEVSGHLAVFVVCQHHPRSIHFDRDDAAKHTSDHGNSYYRMVVQ